MSHTPGPWSAKTNPKGQPYVASDTTKSAVVDAEAVSKDDAALIAAAPELLAVCEAIARRRFDVDLNDGLIEKMALAAIAKATGK